MAKNGWQSVGCAFLLLFLAREDSRCQHCHAFLAWGLVPWYHPQVLLSGPGLALLLLLAWLICRQQLGPGDLPVLLLLLLTLPLTFFAGALLIASTAAGVYWWLAKQPQRLPFVPFLTFAWAVVMVLKILL
ncbi:hypothetical protein PT274_06115 [Leuconostocaceae bacterium ESL0958]|nr:hypothetical protein [Leuconostocaceae bacterium ESL0958]